jgi:HEAT repeat protein
MVAVRASDADPGVRAWATRLLGELPSVDSAEAVALRFLDQDIEVRRAALAAGRMLSAKRAASEALSGALSDVLLDPAKSDQVRHMAIEAIADLRESRAVPGLIRTLESASNDIKRSAHWALVVLTRADFVDDVEAWGKWWVDHAEQHRIEWLIEALTHAEQEIRRAAGDELKSTTKEYFGYYDDLSPRERERAQSRYRDWWNSKGKSRFGS